VDEIIGTVEAVGTMLGRADEGRKLAGLLRARVARVKEIAVRLPTIRVFALEWSDPPFAGGHWVPEMVESVGGVNVLGVKAEPSRQVTWREMHDEMPETIVFMPCGYYLEEAEEEAWRLFEQPDFADTPAAREGNVFAVDATSFFSRPGPRIVDGLEILAWAVHPEAYPEPPKGGISRVGR
jgi:iron complex transport system substrate-binding protein